jgi:hypothetical protein
MGEGQHGDKSHGMKSRLFGYLVAALLLLALASGVSHLVMLWCPRGVDCRATGQILFWSGMLVSAAIAWNTGMAARDFFERRADQPSR